jgi:nicotinamidase-related amidase
MEDNALAVVPARTAVVVMDFQEGIVARGRDPEGTVRRAAVVLAAARSAGVPVVYVTHATPPYDADPVHAGVAPAAGERVLPKTAVGAFSTTGLEVELRRLGRDTVVLMGVSTSGCVLSTVRHGADLGFTLVVVEDGCDDPDAEVHAVLTGTVFPRQATVVTADALAAALGTGLAAGPAVGGG